MVTSDLGLNITRQQGISLIDLMVALIILTMASHGLLRYEQALIVQLQHARANHQSWQLAAQVLELYPNQVAQLSGYQLSIHAIDSRCQSVSVKVNTASSQQIQLQRLYCQ